ncbi:hypothetical protein ACN28S_48720 [Cystobacter fuscus]
MIAVQREAHQSRLQALEQLAESERLRGRAERERAEQVMVNPLLNAADAVEAAQPPRRARITVSACRDAPRGEPARGGRPLRDALAPGGATPPGPS